jgi:hypothetical protein
MAPTQGAKAAYVLLVKQKLTTEIQPDDFWKSEEQQNAFKTGVANGLTTPNLEVTPAMIFIKEVKGNARRIRRGLASTELLISYTITIEREDNGTEAGAAAQKKSVLKTINASLNDAAYITKLSTELTKANMTANPIKPEAVNDSDIKVVALNPTAAPTPAPGLAPAKEASKGIIPGLSNGVFGAIVGVGALAILGGVYSYMNPGALGSMCGSNKVEILPTSEGGVLRPVPGE